MRCSFARARARHRLRARTQPQKRRITARLQSLRWLPRAGDGGRLRHSVAGLVEASHRRTGAGLTERNSVSGRARIALADRTMRTEPTGRLVHPRFRNRWILGIPKKGMRLRDSGAVTLAIRRGDQPSPASGLFGMARSCLRTRQTILSSSHSRSTAANRGLRRSHVATGGETR